jgi:hypothetical protein
MRQIGIHGDIPVVGLSQEHAESLAIGCPDPQLPRTMENTQSRLRCLHRFEQLASLVRRAIVDEKEVEIERERKQTLDQWKNIFALVKSRYDCNYLHVVFLAQLPFAHSTGVAISSQGTITQIDDVLFDALPKRYPLKAFSQERTLQYAQ